MGVFDEFHILYIFAPFYWHLTHHLCTNAPFYPLFCLDVLFDECEHDLPISDLGEVCVGTIDLIHENNLEVPTFLPKSHIEIIPPNLDLVCNKTFKPNFLKIPNLGLELCASQVLLDYFASKYNTFKEPQLECISLPIPKTVHYELDLLNPEPLKLKDFVLKSKPVEQFRFRGNSFGFSLSFPFKSNFSVLKLSMSLHELQLTTVHLRYYCRPASYYA